MFTSNQFLYFQQRIFLTLDIFNIKNNIFILHTNISSNSILKLEIYVNIFQQTHLIFQSLQLINGINILKCKIKSISLQIIYLSYPDYFFSLFLPHAQEELIFDNEITYINGIFPKAAYLRVQMLCEKQGRIFYSYFNAKKLEVPIKYNVTRLCTFYEF